MRLLPILVLGVLLFPAARVDAQSFYAFEVPIAPEGAVIGRLSKAPVTLLRWATPTRPVLRFQDADVAFETTVDLDAPEAPAEPRAHIVAGVRARTTLAAGLWNIRMSAGAWAPVRGLDATGTRVALPPGMPVPEATIPAGVPGAAGQPTNTAFHFSSASARGFDEFACGSFAMRATAAADAPQWTVPNGAFYRVRRARGAITIEARMDGFVVVGFVDSEAERCEAMLGLTGIGSSCGDGASRGLVVRVPSGTPLYASPSATTPFTRTRREILGRERLDGERAVACRTPPGGAPICTSTPPEPTGPATLLFLARDGSRSPWSFEAHMRLAVETLPRVTNAAGFGSCGAPLTDWPPRR